MRLSRRRPEPGRVRQARSPGRSAAPAFSYYNNRPSAERSAKRSVKLQPISSNPVRTDRSSRRFSLSQLPFWLLVVLIAILGTKLLLLTPVAKVVVLGNTATTKAYTHPISTYAAAANKVLASSLTNRTKLTVNVSGTAQTLERQFPELQTVSVTLPLMGNRPIVYVLVAQPSLVLQTAHGKYALNKSGLVLAQLTAQPANVPVAVDQSGASPQTGRQFLPGSTIAFIQMVAYQFSAAKLSIASFVLPAASPYELDVQPAGKAFTIRFNLQEDARQQSGAAIATLQHMGAALPSSYLDVRVPERVYYK